MEHKLEGKQQIGDFIVNFKKELGNGACGKVYEGYQANNKENKVAVKIQNIEQLKKLVPEKWKDIISRESKIIKSLDSPYIVKAFDVKLLQKPQEYLLIFMEKCDQTTLEQFIYDQNNDEQKCKTVFKQILQGYEQLYSKQIIHRDLKPENILFKDGIVKIADLGLSKYLNGNTQQKITVAGTIKYRPPETLNTEKYAEVDEPLKMDIWSLGLIYYEMLYKKLPWDTETIDIYLQQILSKPLSFPASPAVSDDAKDLLSRMLQIEADDRYNYEQVMQHPYVK